MSHCLDYFIYLKYTLNLAVLVLEAVYALVGNLVSDLVWGWGLNGRSEQQHGL